MSCEIRGSAVDSPILVYKKTKNKVTKLQSSLLVGKIKASPVIYVCPAGSVHDGRVPLDV